MVEVCGGLGARQDQHCANTDVRVRAAGRGAARDPRRSQQPTKITTPQYTLTATEAPRSNSFYMHCFTAQAV